MWYLWIQVRAQYVSPAERSKPTAYRSQIHGVESGHKERSVLSSAGRWKYHRNTPDGWLWTSKVEKASFIGFFNWLWTQACDFLTHLFILLKLITQTWPAEKAWQTKQGYTFTSESMLLRSCTHVHARDTRTCEWTHVHQTSALPTQHFHAAGMSTVPVFVEVKCKPWQN